MAKKKQELNENTFNKFYQSTRFIFNFLYCKKSTDMELGPSAEYRLPIILKMREPKFKLGQGRK